MRNFFNPSVNNALAVFRKGIADLEWVKEFHTAKSDFFASEIDKLKAKAEKSEKEIKDAKALINKLEEFLNV